MKQKIKKKTPEKSPRNKSKEIKKKILSAKGSSVRPSPRSIQQHSIEYEIPILDNKLKELQNQVVKQVAFFTDVYEANSLPKCIFHKNIITMYCKNDHKPLCANCLYSNQSHKKHHVLPLAKAQVEIKKDFQDFLFLSKKSLKDVQELIKRNQENAKNTQDVYPSIIENINTFYSQFHEILAEKQSQQTRQIYENWSRLKYTYSKTKKELEKIAELLKVSLSDMNEKCEVEELVHIRNIAGELSKIKNIITIEVAQGQGNRFEADTERFLKLEEIVKKELNFTNLYQLSEEVKKISKQMKSQEKIAKTLKFNKKSFHLSAKAPKSSTSISPNKNRSENRTQPFAKQKTERSLLKNRHSRSDLLKKMKVEEQTREKQVESLKKKNTSFLNKLKQKKQQEKQKQLDQEQANKMKMPEKHDNFRKF